MSVSQHVHVELRTMFRAFRRMPDTRHRRQCPRRLQSEVLLPAMSSDGILNFAVPSNHKTNPRDYWRPDAFKIASLLSLPTEILRTIIDLIPTPTPFSTEPKPLLELDSTLRRLCAVNRRLRRICLPLTYKKIYINLSRISLETQCSALTETSSSLTDPDILRFAKYVESIIRL